VVLWVHEALHRGGTGRIRCSCRREIRVDAFTSCGGIGEAAERYTILGDSRRGRLGEQRPLGEARTQEDPGRRRGLADLTDDRQAIAIGEPVVQDDPGPELPREGERLRCAAPLPDHPKVALTVEQGPEALAYAHRSVATGVGPRLESGDER
jgi:hypothetical protein